jgi:hypothetical protein
VRVSLSQRIWWIASVNIVYRLNRRTAVGQIIEDPQDVIAVPVEFRHRPIEIIFMALESNAPDLPAKNGMTATSKILRANWFEGYNVEEDVDVLASLPIAEALEEWEW